MGLSMLLISVFVMLQLIEVRGVHECNSLLINDVFRCTVDKKFCLATSDVICREPFLSTVQCPDGSNQWRSLCDRICFTGFGIRRGFKCNDGTCITNFMKWCDGNVDCPYDRSDEDHCNCTSRPSDCRHWVTVSPTRHGIVSSQYLFRRIFAPMGFFIIILVVWKYYRTMKLRQRLASLQNNPDVRLCDTDVVYVGGVTDVERRNRNSLLGSEVGGLGPPPYTSSDIGPPPYPSSLSNTPPAEPPSYQESVSQTPNQDNEGRSANLRVNLPPVDGVTADLLPPPPSYDSLAPNK